MKPVKVSDEPNSLKKPTGDTFCEECMEFDRKYPECMESCPCRECTIMNCGICYYKTSPEDDHMYYFEEKSNEKEVCNNCNQEMFEKRSFKPKDRNVQKLHFCLECFTKIRRFFKEHGCLKTAKWFGEEYGLTTKTILLDFL